VQLAASAAWTLGGNDTGSMITAAPRLYPHMWSWDAAFVAIGLAKVNLRRAVRELETLLSAQWATGMLPHIVFAPGDRGYFPGPDRWACRESGAPAPAEPPTSGICQPPVHALAVERLVAAGRRGRRSEREVAGCPKPSLPIQTARGATSLPTSRSNRCATRNAAGSMRGSLEKRRPSRA